MTGVDWLDLLAQELGFVLKIGAEGSFRVAAEGKGCFLCPTNSVIYQKFVHAKSSLSSVQRPTVIVISPVLKRGIDRKHTTFTSCQNAACSNELFSLSGRLCFGGKRFDWAKVNFGRFLNIFHTERSWHAYWFSLVGMISPLMQEHFHFSPLKKCKVLYCGWLRVLGCLIFPKCLLDLNNSKRFSLCPWMWLFPARFFPGVLSRWAHLVSVFNRMLKFSRIVMYRAEQFSNVVHFVTNLSLLPRATFRVLPAINLSVLSPN